MVIRIFAFVWLCLCSLAAAAAPQGLPVPTVSYSADRIMETEGNTFTGRVYSSGGRERTEIDMQGMPSVMILRPDRQLGWMLMPAQRMYQELDFAKARQQAGTGPSDEVTITEEGADTVEGLATTKYKLLMKDGSAGGFIWFTADGIAVKMDLLSKDGGRKSRMTVTLRNLQVGDVDPQLFELPTGYTAMPSFPGMGAGKGAKGALSGLLGRGGR